jgi:hypothetical protein
MTDQELQELKEKVERLDKMYNLAFILIAIFIVIYAIKSTL